MTLFHDIRVKLDKRCQGCIRRASFHVPKTHDHKKHCGLDGFGQLQSEPLPCSQKHPNNTSVTSSRKCTSRCNVINVFAASKFSFSPQEMPPQTKSTFTLIRGIFSLLFRRDPAGASKCCTFFTGWKAAQIKSSKPSIDRRHLPHHPIDMCYEGNSACEPRISFYDASSTKVGGLFKST
jgi:hypothetical protein